MPTPLSPEIVAALDDPSSVKVLVTVAAAGDPHALITDFLGSDGDGAVLYFEPLESSAANRNLIGSLWFERSVSIALRTADDRRFQIVGRPVKALVAGPVFQRHYEAFRARFGDLDLATVWVIEPLAHSDLDFGRAREEQASNRPFFQHLDRIARPA